MEIGYDVLCRGDESRRRMCEVGKRLRALRKAHGYTQEEVSFGVGISRAGCCDIELGRRGMTVEELVIFCELYDISADELCQTKYAAQTKMCRQLEEFAELTEKNRREVAEFIDFKKQLQSKQNANTHN